MCVCVCVCVVCVCCVCVVGRLSSRFCSSERRLHDCFRQPYTCTIIAILPPSAQCHPSNSVAASTGKHVPSCSVSNQPAPGNKATSTGLPQVDDCQQHSTSEAGEGQRLAQRTPHLQNGIVHFIGQAHYCNRLRFHTTQPSGSGMNPILRDTMSE